LKKFYVTFTIIFTAIYLLLVGIYVFDKKFHKPKKFSPTPVARNVISTSPQPEIAAPPIEEATQAPREITSASNKPPSPLPIKSTPEKNDRDASVLEALLDKTVSTVGDSIIELADEGSDKDRDNKNNTEIKRSPKDMTEDELFELILTNPSALEVNIELARKELESNKLKEASITLERIVQLYPDLIEPQLLLAQTEFKLGNYIGARELYQNITKNPLATRQQVGLANESLTFLSGLEKKWDFFATGLLGFGSNKNPTNSPQFITILGNPYQNTSFNNKMDSYTEAYAMAGLKYHLESQNESSLFSSLALYNRHYNQFSSVDLLNINLSLGYEHQILGGKNIYALSASKTDLGNKPFVNSYVLNFSHEHFIGSNLKTILGITSGYNKHQECDSCASSDTRTNTLNAMNAGITLGLTDKWIVDGSGGVSNFDAKANYESFSQYNALLATTYSLPLGNVSLGKNYNFSRYDDLDPLAGIRREITLNTNYLSFMTAPLHLRAPMKDDWALKLNTQWGKSESPILTYQKDILETSLSVIKSF